MKTVAAVPYSLQGLDNKQNYGAWHFHDRLLQNSIFPHKFQRFDPALLYSRYIFFFTFCETILRKAWIVREPQCSVWFTDKLQETKAFSIITLLF